MDCDKLVGRMRDICLGTSGLSEEKRQAYLAIWFGGEHPARYDKMCGTRLKNLIAWFPIPNKKGCQSCRNLEMRMNNWGPEICLEKMPFILKKLHIAAKRRGLPFSRRLVEILVRRAING